MKSSKKNVSSNGNPRRIARAVASEPNQETVLGDGMTDTELAGEVVKANAPPSLPAYSGDELKSKLLRAGKLEREGSRLMAEAGAIYLDCLRCNGGGPWTLLDEAEQPTFMLSRCRGAGEGGVERGFRKALTQHSPTVL